MRSAGEVVVADNGSTDGSRQLAEAAGARVVPVEARGYGAALDAGIKSARFSVVVFGDADMSYPFNELSKLVQPIFEGRADFVLGSRLRGSIARGAMPFLNRHLGTPVLSFLIRRFYGLPISDCNSGMRALLSRRYRDLGLRCPGMEYASEMLIRVQQKGLRYGEVPIGFRKDQRTRAPHLRPWRDGWRHLRFIMANAPSLYFISLPLGISTTLLLFALGLSLETSIFPGRVLHYHSAFGAIAIAMPLLMFAVSNLLVKSALHFSGQVESKLVAWVQKASEQSLPIIIAMGFFGMMAVQMLLLVARWSENSWVGALSEIEMMIRIVIFAAVGTSFLGLDMGLAIFKLLPYQAIERNEDETPQKQAA